MTAKISLACDIVKVEASVGNDVYAGSAVVVKVRETKVLVTADHIIPTERLPSEIKVIFENKDLGRVRILRRDWSSDLMILTSANSTEPMAHLKECPIGQLTELDAFSKLSLKGYSLAQTLPASLDAVLVDLLAKDVQIAQPTPLIKVMGLADKGMSGGALLSSDGSFTGLIIQEWCTRQNSLKGGVYALNAQYVHQRALQMMDASMDTSGTTVEIPLPFAINRDSQEIRVHGFRFRSLAPIACRNTLIAKGGHPDGIGGEKEPAGIEVSGLSGQTVPRNLEPMAQVLRTIQSQGGIQMVIRQTQDLKQVPNLTALARMLLLDGGKTAGSLDYSLLNIPGHKGSSLSTEFSKLLSQVVVDSSFLAQWNPKLASLAERVRGAQENWVRHQSLSTLENLLRDLPGFQEELNRLIDTSARAWEVYLEFRTRLERLKYQLDRDESPRPRRRSKD